ncbi:flexible cuticle protein 12-like [Uranotaenia lowii]|uniref:flexible cuticle protein 12-like n=1 Tax=Uranotaenia lowii TaxID=190385 RepID=UPI002478E5BF|nr:flexible cuticle protein 12-like [Uranotaenia lowii]
MKVVLVFCVLAVGAIWAAPQGNPADAQILKYESDNIGIDGYSFQFETSDGTSRSEQAELRNAGTDAASIVVRGSYSYIGPDGTQYVINYVADENGFQPEGAHIPK